MGIKGADVLSQAIWYPRLESTAKVVIECCKALKLEG